VIQRILETYTRVLEKIIIILMGALLISVALQVMGRYVPFIPRYLWTEEVANFSLIWTIFLGSIIGVREGKHFFVDFLPKNLSPGLNKAVRVIYYIFMYGVVLIFVIFGYRFFLMGYIQESELTGLNLGAIYISVPLAGISWFIFLAENIYKEFFASSGKGK